MYEPKRVQHQRTRGWRTPLCGCGCNKPAIYVGRPTRWGNPVAPVKTRDSYTITSPRTGRVFHYETRKEALHGAYRAYGALLGPGKNGIELIERARNELAGHDLMCWCPLDQPCHADILLQIANPKEPRK